MSKPEPLEALGANLETEAEIIHLPARTLPPFWRHRSLLIGLIIVAVILIATILAPFFTHYDPVLQDPADTFLSPRPGHPFGTDQFGRDVLARVLYGGRNTIAGSIVSILIATIVGTWLGLVAGYFGGFLDMVIMRLIDLLLAFPGLLLALTLATIFGPGLNGTVVAIGIAFVPGTGRIVQGVTLQASNYMYVAAARALGVPNWAIMWRHILPNVFAQVVVLATTGLGLATLSVAALGFLGLGLQPPSPEWGAILNGGRDYVTLAWWVTFFPGLAIALYVTSVNLIGDGLRELLDPTLAMRTK
jgi:ABC-type dipeptide/oligopeptide/nickel transport system permease subunit